VNDERIDPELLAAVLDGTASERERAAVLERLATSKDAYARFLEAVAIQSELEQPPVVARPAPVTATAPATVIPLEARRRPLRFLAPVLSLAAALSIVVLATSRSTTPEVIQLAEAGHLTTGSGAGSVAQALGATWDDRGWSVMRGAEAVEGAPARAFRAGVRVAQLTMAANAGDSAAVARQAGNLGELLATVDGSSPLVLRLATLAQQGGSDQARARRELASQLRAVLGAEGWFDLGVWTESAHAAARNGELEFFAAGGGPLTALTRLLARPGTPAEQWERETRALRALSANGAHDRSELPAIDGVLTKVLAAAGG
jgi:hypothetical protein